MDQEYLRQKGRVCVIVGCKNRSKRRGQSAAYYCRVHRNQGWAVRNPESAAAAMLRRLDYQRRKKYGIGNAEVEAMVAKQGGCAACGATEPGGRGEWHVDHDHETKEVRGILCASCNLTIGFAKENELRLLACAAYLASFAQPQAIAA